MTNAIASPAYCNTAGPAAATTTTVSAKSSVAAATSLLLIVVLNLLWIRLPNGNYFNYSSLLTCNIVTASLIYSSIRKPF